MSLKRILIGSPIETVREKHERLSKSTGLAIFSSDALSSVAYATEEILLALVVAGTALIDYSMVIAVGIAILIAIVSTSYFQTIHAYPSGGGAYIVAKDNLGTNAGLVAGAALLIDYVLTVAVSITAGVAALSSAIPSIYNHKVLISLVAIALLMIGNLRGVREAGKIFSIPTFIFIISMFVLISVGAARYFSGDPAPEPQVLEATSSYFALFVVLKAFASGCTALTGIEAVSNGIRAFKAPEPRNASVTLIWMAAILGSMFIGITFLTDHYNILPMENETVLSQLTAAIFSRGPFYYVVQFATAFILILAANTSFADFPRLSSVMAADGFMPRQFGSRGDRLVFSNGILILGLLAMSLVVVFKGQTHALIPLYAVGVFLSFTLSQSGMVRHWLRLKGKGWQKGIVINGTGAITTFVVLIVIASAKFLHGAWIVIIAIPVIVYLTKKVKRHYDSVADQLSLTGRKVQVEYTHHSVIVPVSGAHQAVVNAIRYAKALSEDAVAVYVCFDPMETTRVKQKWNTHGMGVPLIVLESEYRSVIEPLMDYIDGVRETHRGGVITVVLPEFVPTRWWQHLLHNQTAWMIKGILLFKRGVVSTSVPLHLDDK
ncbi:MAG: APC family permease [Thermoleophilia bacterium]|nr:APC family permease [Thermoleophilia bacterium]